MQGMDHSSVSRNYNFCDHYKPEIFLYLKKLRILLTFTNIINCSDHQITTGLLI